MFKDLWSKFAKTILSAFDRQKSRFGNSKAGTIVAEYLAKDIKLIPVLKWAGIGAAAFIVDATILGALAGGIVKSFSSVALTIKGLPPSDLVGPGWYLTHPFKISWVFLRHMFGAPINITNVFNTWVGLNIIGGLAIAASIIYGKYARNKHDRDIQKIKFVKVNYDIEKEIKKTPAGQIFLGLNDMRRPIYLPVNKLAEHIHVLGGAGTGKTSFAIIPLCVQAIRYGLSVVAVDFKGDLQAIQLLAREAQKAGKKFYYFSLHPTIKSNSYNPLNSGTSLSKVERVLTALELVFQGAAKYYTYCQQAIFIPILRYFETRGIKCSMRDIREILRDPELVKEITREVMTLSQVQGLTAALTPFADLKRINDIEPDIDLAEIMKNGDVVYFDLRSAEAPEFAASIGKMLAMDLQAQAALRTQQDRLVVVAIDEFQNMACNAFKNIIAKVRSANYAMVLANQALGDLKSVSEDFLNTVATNTATKIVFNVEDPADADYFARKTGQVVVDSHGQSSSRDAIHPLVTRTRTESSQEYDKHFIHANVFLKLPFSKSVIFQRGQLASLGNHVHLISKAEKDRLELEPYPKPVSGIKHGVKTASGEIRRLKMIIIERKKQEKQDQNQAQGQPRQQPGQGENAGVETEDIAM
ncbi:MAG: AAA-like domain protein [Pelotomaculum sp. PtaB.Bin013]|uniref:Type IV secretory system conjugative DNA transfer family protein n=1 Tax=Pelotomaculum isophthalicicum JI TaxID=947010 RepID=A0A9X4JWK0_9FIRM|nr:type IV secretory system conjugative DNA transfer family protein [Pelotomaculum isophthalicicum]MDF9409507.1 type IV secretory system conjugative DNA transfer family protein [Pelotomaculum isophthalicicum JI]OPX92194.1 MAG: AAA-like domain protein [Pelotomaculum sp. PtaB.Bin013]